MAARQIGDTGATDEHVAAIIVQLLNGRSIASAESCTAGRIATVMARVPKASEFFRGGLVAYQEHVKRDLLGVSAASVLSRRAAEEMASGVAHLLGADVTVATTGVAGETAEDGTPPGIVYIGVRADGAVSSTMHRFNGSPDAVCEQACSQALAQLMAALTDSASRRTVATDTTRPTADPVRVPDHDTLPPDVEYTFDHDPAAAQGARHALSPLIDEPGDPIAPAVEMVASELVTNVVRHTDDGGVVKAWDPKPDMPFHLEVSDTDPKVPRPVVAPGAHGGFGMRIVDQLADEWGVEPDTDGKTVWAEFNRPRKIEDPGAES